MDVVNVVAPGALVTLLISVVSTYIGPLLVHPHGARTENDDPGDAGPSLKRSR